MKTVAIISEYNPFHNGHLYQINRIREEFGEDTAIISVMSGNYTQRGEIAIMDKWERARCAVECGVNLTLELPFPYSISSAELFARAAVHIIDSLGVVDYISFGSESGDIENLTRTAQNMLKPEFAAAYKTVAEDKGSSSLGYAKQCEIAYERAFGIPQESPTPNNILAIEYIKALILCNSKILPHTIKREGAAYDEGEILDTPYQSATAIRSEVQKALLSAKDYVPKTVYKIMFDALSTNAFPTDVSRLDGAVISKFRLISDCKCDIHDASGGLYNRLINKSYEVSTLSDLITLSATKKYTKARIMRTVWYTFFGVTSSDIKEKPHYTQLLAMDKIGQALLKKIKKTGSIPVITKPSTSVDSPDARKAKELSDKADMIYQLSKPTCPPASSIYKRTPFVKG